MKKLFVVLAMVFAMIFCSGAFAQVVTVDLSKLDSQSRNSVIDANQKVAESPALTVENLDKFKAYGIVISTTLKEVCQTLNIEVNNFIKTPVGILTTGLIVYKIIGKDIIHAVYVICLCTFLFALLLTSFFIFHIPKKTQETVANKADTATKTSIKYIQRYEFSSDEAKLVSVIAHIVGFAAVVIIALVVV